MKNYVNLLENKYYNIIKELRNTDGGSIGDVIKRIHNICKSKNVDSSKSEIRDALIMFTVKKKIRIEKHVPRRLEIIFESEG